MKPVRRKKEQPELAIRTRIIKYLNERGWFTVITHGNIYQMGLPDILAVHKVHGHRWIEVKNPGSYKLTIAQLETFPKICESGDGPFQTGVWILIDATKDEYDKLFRQCNWHTYLPIFKSFTHGLPK